MDRLSVLITVMTGSALVGGLVVVVLSLGFYGWVPIAVAAGAGLLLAWPTAYAISRRIKREDPDWPPRGRPRRGGSHAPASQN